jgi:thiamine kinase-like enzyme
MIETLAAGLSELRGQPVTIRQMQREPFVDSSSFSTECLLVLVNDGEWLEVFFKDLNPRHQLADAQSLRHKPELDRSYRELRMYRDVLSRLQLGTPELYAWRWEPQHDSFWLFLEHIDSDRLTRSGFERWVEAARWAARFHAAVRELPLTEADFLIHLDRDHYRHCANRLEQNFSNFNPEQQPIIRQALNDYDGILEQLVALPRHLIHGEFFGQNVMIRQANPAEPIAVIDWETAAIGPGYIDLVSISAGQWTPEQRQAMWRAYFEQYQAETGLPMDWEHFCQEVGQVALYRALWWLGWWSNGDANQITHWMQELINVTRETVGSPSA